LYLGRQFTVLIVLANLALQVFYIPICNRITAFLAIGFLISCKDYVTMALSRNSEYTLLLYKTTLRSLYYLFLLCPLLTFS
jgi:hypothetical protein